MANIEPLDNATNSLLSGENIATLAAIEDDDQFISVEDEVL